VKMSFEDNFCIGFYVVLVLENKNGFEVHVERVLYEVLYHLQYLLLILLMMMVQQKLSYLLIATIFDCRWVQKYSFRFLLFLIVSYQVPLPVWNQL
jgi:hypothetical protein